MNKLADEQDYIVISDQRWLDSIYVEPGIVKQFVAAETAAPIRTNASRPYPRPISPVQSAKSRVVIPNQDEPLAFGASIEWQKTGKDSVCGIQLQTIAEFDIENMSALSIAHTCRQAAGSDALRSFDEARETQARQYDVLKTPRELGLSEGETIHLKGLGNLQPARPKTVTDLAQESPVCEQNRIPQDVEIEMRYLPPLMIAIKVSDPRKQKLTALFMPEYSTIRDIKRVIGYVPVEEQQLVLNTSVELEDHCSMSKYGIVPVSKY